MDFPRRAAFVAVGSELLRADRTDTNSLLAARLASRCGYAFVEKRAVEDDEESIAVALRELCSRMDLVVVSGGLGPTADDVTREGVARAFDLEIVRLAALESALAKRYALSGRTMPEVARKMADVVEGAEVLPNPQGTAPGQLVQRPGCTVVLLPGVPREFETIFTTHLVQRFACADRARSRALHLAGVFESDVEQRVSHLYQRWGRERVTILAHRGLVDLVLTVRGTGAEETLAAMEAEFAQEVGDDLFGRDSDTLPGVVLDRLRRLGLKLAVAESCTGGMVAAALTAVPGASDVFLGGVVAYDNSLKESLLGVPHEALLSHGAVSREVAEAMARGGLKLGADCSLAITGIAGPAGGSEEKPVGTVYMAVATRAGASSVHHRLPGDRALIRELAANFSMDMLRRTLEPS